VKQVYRYDLEGFYVEPVILEDKEDIPANCTEKNPENGLFKAIFVNGQWVEGMSQEEIEVIKNTQPVSGIEELKKQQELMQQALDDLIFGGAL
jgi:hypothetical protein